MTLWDFLSQALGLFDTTLQAIMNQPFFALLLGLLVLLLVAGMLGWLMYLGRKRKL